MPNPDPTPPVFDTSAGPVTAEWEVPYRKAKAIVSSDGQVFHAVMWRTPTGEARSQPIFYPSLVTRKGDWMHVDGIGLPADCDRVQLERILRRASNLSVDDNRDDTELHVYVPGLVPETTMTFKFDDCGNLRTVES